MRQAPALLGHPRHKFNLNATLRAQLIGSGAPLLLQAETLLGWDIFLSKRPDLKHGFNQFSLIEFWLEAESGPIYGMAKYFQDVAGDRLIFRIVDIDTENRARLESLLEAQAPESLSASS